MNIPKHKGLFCKKDTWLFFIKALLHVYRMLKGPECVFPSLYILNGPSSVWETWRLLQWGRRILCFPLIWKQKVQGRSLFCSWMLHADESIDNKLSQGFESFPSLIFLWWCIMVEPALWLPWISLCHAMRWGCPGHTLRIKEPYREQ